MPIPMTVAIYAMRLARNFHNAPSIKRPLLLKKVYYARLLSYATFVVGFGISVYTTNTLEHVSNEKK